MAHLGHSREEGLKQDGHCLRTLGYPGTAGHGLQHLVKWCQPGDTMGLLSAYPQFLPEGGMLWPDTSGQGSPTPWDHMLHGAPRTAEPGTGQQGLN